MFSSLRAKLAFSHLGVIFGTVAILALITYGMGLQIHKEATFENLRKSSINSSVTIQNFISNKQNVIKRVSESREASLYSRNFQDIALAAFLEGFTNEFSSLSYISPSGAEEVRLDNGKVNYSLRNLAANPLFRQAVENPGSVILGITGPDRDLSVPTFVFTLAKKRYFDDTLIHVIQASVPLTTLEKHLTSFFEWSFDSPIIADSENTILIHPQTKFLQTKLHLPQKDKGIGEVDQLGLKGVYNSIVIASPAWKIVNVLPYEKYMEAPIRYAKIVLSVVGSVLLVGLLVVFFIARKINAPISDLTKAVSLISQEKKVELLQPYDIDELDNLVDAFNTMFFELTETTISKEYLNNIVNSLRECLIVTSLNGTIESANQMTFDLLECTEEQLIGQSIKTIFPGDIDSDTPLLGSSNPEEIETSLITFTQEEIPINFYKSILKSKHGTDQGIVFLALDIRKRKKIEKEKEKLKAQLHNAQRLETVGTLAAGISHDFNNILTIILGYSQILQYTAKDDDSKNYIKQILAASNRAKDLVRQLLEFSRQGSHASMEISLDTIIKEIIKLLKSSIPASVEISEEIQSGCSSIIADPTKIRQIIMNLCGNAIHAIGDYGTLTIKLGEEQVDSNITEQYQGVPSGQYVKLMICDTGHGIEESDLDRIFDPFFTTKVVDTGTGLGLAVVHGIVQSLQGHIFVESKKDAGTTFTVLFPALAKSEAQNTSAISAAFPASMHSKKEHILFVDDEESIVKLGERNLQILGYKVTCTTSSEQALDYFRNNPSTFDLLITDFSMPKMQGDKLIQEIRQIRRDLPVILCTGYHAKLVKTKRIEGAHRIIKKPYTNEILANEVKKILDQENM